MGCGGGRSVNGFRSFQRHDDDSVLVVKGFSGVSGGKVAECAWDLQKTPKVKIGGTGTTGVATIRVPFWNLGGGQAAGRTLLATSQGGYFFINAGLDQQNGDLIDTSGAPANSVRLFGRVATLADPFATILPLPSEVNCLESALTVNGLPVCLGPISCDANSCGIDPNSEGQGPGFSISRDPAGYSVQFGRSTNGIPVTLNVTAGASGNFVLSCVNGGDCNVVFGRLKDGVFGEIWATSLNQDTDVDPEISCNLGADTCCVDTDEDAACEATFSLSGLLLKAGAALEVGPTAGDPSCSAGEYKLAPTTDAGGKWRKCANGTWSDL